MTAYYKKYQEMREKSPNVGKWYGRAVYTGTVTERDMAEEIEKRSTVHLADVLAVLASMKELIKTYVQDSKRVRLADLGTFKLGFSSSPSEKAEDFDASNIMRPHLLFTEERVIGADHTVQTRAFASGVKFKEYGSDTSSKTKKTSSDSSSSGSGSSDSGTGGTSAGGEKA